MKTIAVTLIALLALVTSVEAVSYCPATLDLVKYPYGTCICGAPGIPNGGIAGCAVIVNAAGALSCSCQSAGSPIACQSPGLTRCGGVAPFCSTLDLCTGTTATTCVSIGGAPAYAPDCFIRGTGLVNPLACACYTTVVRRPLSQEQKALHQAMADTLSGYSIAAGVTLSFPGMPLALNSAMKLAQALFSLAAIREQAIANDPLDCAYTELATPYTMAYALVAPDKSVSSKTLAVLNAWLTTLTDVGQALDAAQKSQDRWSCAVRDAAVPWQEAQLAQFDDAMDVFQSKLPVLVTAQQAVVGQRWDKKLRPVLAPLVDPTSLQVLEDMATADLHTQP